MPLVPVEAVLVTLLSGRRCVDRTGMEAHHPASGGIWDMCLLSLLLGKVGTREKLSLCGGGGEEGGDDSETLALPSVPPATREKMKLEDGVGFPTAGRGLHVLLLRRVPVLSGVEVSSTSQTGASPRSSSIRPTAARDFSPNAGPRRMRRREVAEASLPGANGNEPQRP